MRAQSNSQAALAGYTNRLEPASLPAGTRVRVLSHSATRPNSVAKVLRRSPLVGGHDFYALQWPDGMTARWFHISCLQVLEGVRS